MLLSLQLLDEVSTGLVEIGIDEIKVYAHAERHSHSQTLLKFDAVFAVASPTTRSGLGCSAVPLARLVT